MTREPRRILIVQPSWVGDAVMATPMLRAMRSRFPDAHIAYLMRRYVKPIYAGMPWVDRLITYRVGKTDRQQGRGRVFDLAARVRAGRFDTAVLLPNSFKTALVCRLAGVPRIVGYDRDGRGLLLTDRLAPPREQGRLVPSPIIHYYAALATHLGADAGDLTMQLFVTTAERSAAMQTLREAGLPDDIDRPRRAGGPPLVILNPGAQYGDAKCWLPEYFAAVGDRLSEELGATVLVSSSPREKKIVDEIRAAARRPFVDLARYRPRFGAVKELSRRCDLMITNDTGPRHIAAALGVPVVTVFGPTHPQWTEIYYKLERKVSIPVECGPCQLKKCPLDHRCMKGVTPRMVYERACELMNR